ncbi:GNAT family N-acetyltransferase [Xenorhabdus bovienii]|uniref:GNAT family N-acetyltransferase n=1 Tax=Xenorhabdus bovienii TaxID=40576 RepID=UPI001EE0DBB2|nr:GNAT family protein [Xenorhabdus bovienii]MCG3462482.1 GNAT family N-acetyltransferase [Xenorhabdus bovienii]
MNWKNLKDIMLNCGPVTLRRIQITDRDAFERIAYEQEIWRYFVAKITNATELDCFIEQAIQDSLNGTRVVFAIIDNRSGEIVGSTAFGNISESERRIEIGWSWLSAEARRSGINRAAKFALIDYAFEQLGCERVEFKTDVLNTPARTGLEGLGAQKEGVLRSFNYMPGGHRRDVIYYSLLRHEWPAVKSARFSHLYT